MTGIKMSLKKTIIGIVSGAAILVCMAFYMFYPTQYLALDVNPSIEFETNRLGRVVSMVGVNEDARELLGDYNADGKKMDVVLEEVVDRMVKSGYIAQGKVNDILITSEKGTKSDKILLQISEKVQEELKKHELTGEIATQSITLNENMTKSAAENQVSAGKMAVIDQLTKQDVSLTAKDLANTRISDLLAYAEKNNISLDTLENHLEALQDAGGEDAHLEELEEGVDDAKDAIEDKDDAAKDAEEDALEALEDAKEAEEEAQDVLKDAEDEAKDIAEEKAEKLADEAEEAAEKAKEAKEQIEEDEQDKKDAVENKNDVDSDADDSNDND